MVREKETKVPPERQHRQDIILSIKMNGFHPNETDSIGNNPGLDLDLDPGKVNPDEEQSIPETIAVCRSYSSSWDCCDDDSDAVTSLDEVITIDKNEKQITINPNSETDDLHKGRRSFSLEMMCCLTILFVIGVGVRIMWRRYADPSITRAL
jgi:hypothetical protein